MRHIGVFSFVFAKLSLLSSVLGASLPPRADDAAADVTPLDATPAAAIDGVIGMPWGMDTGAGMAVLPVLSLFALFVTLPVAMVMAANNHGIDCYNASI